MNKWISVPVIVGKAGYATAAIAEYEKLTRLERLAFIKDRTVVTLEEENEQRLNLERQINEIAAEQTEQGFWITDGRIRCGDFVKNCRGLCEYLELWKKSNVGGIERGNKKRTQSTNLWELLFFYKYFLKSSSEI